MKAKKKEKLTFPFRKLLVCLLSYHLISPSAWRTKMKRKLPAMKELLMQICCTDTLTFSLNMIFTNDADADDDDRYILLCSVCLSVCHEKSSLPISWNHPSVTKKCLSVTKNHHFLNRVVNVEK